MRTTLRHEGPRNKSQLGTHDDVSGERPMIDADHRVERMEVAW
jgi:hypothetical protein